MGHGSILFVCTGNICRSVMAEWLLRDRLEREEMTGWDVSSAGVAAPEGGFPSPEVVAILGEKGINAAGHRARTVSVEMIEESTLILALERRHTSWLERMTPEASAKTRALGSFIPGNPVEDISDPFGMSEKEYHKCERIIASSMDGLVEFLKGLAP